MSKSDGWNKLPSGWEWRKDDPRFKVEVVKVTGGYPGRPYEWLVLALPRPAGERWKPLGRGCEAKLADAKAAADRVIAATPPERTDHD